MRSRKLEALQIVAEGFGDLLSKVVFIGGTVLDLYLTDRTMPENRSSDEVDCLISVSGLGFWLEWERTLLRRGFTKEKNQHGPHSRWTYGGVRLRLIASPPKMAGFENRWFEEGLFHARYYRLEGGLKVRVFDPVYFTAAKLEALGHRGWYDLRRSEDFEDLIFLIEGRAELFGEIECAFYQVREYIRERLQGLLTHPGLEEAIYCVLPVANSTAQVSRLVLRLRELASGRSLQVA